MIEVRTIHSTIAREIGERVYFLTADDAGLVKIGTSFHPGRRFAEISMMSPVPLHFIGSVDGGVDVEAQWHRDWAHLRSHGEWFHLTPELFDAIDLACLVGLWNNMTVGQREKFRAAIPEMRGVR